jgi:phosphoribosylamine--glycine ligase
MNVLIIGSGGREHALAHKISKSDLLEQLYISPGNPGTADLGMNITIDITNHREVSDFLTNKNIKFLVVGPEAPLVDGLIDSINRTNPEVITVGPGKEGAQLEGSKAYAKAFMSRHNIPTAGYFECTKHNLDEGIAFLSTMNSPYVLKADGLAAGKGVLIIDDITEAQNELKSMLNGKFGAASEKVVIEEFLDGIEFSVFALTDGKSFILLPEAKDYKRIGEGDTGLNTGGMGAISPVPFADETLMNKVIDQIIKPTIDGLNTENISYNGFVFFGLINVDGNPFVIEYNCRMGDPETEVILPRLKNDLLKAIIAMHEGTLSNLEVAFDERSAATVILVSGGYPEKYEKGKVISKIPHHPNGYIYHSGTALKENRLVTNGGRVLAITSFDLDYKMAVDKSLEIASNIEFEGKYFRKDIGFDLL